MVARHSSLELQLTNNYNVNETTSVPDVTSRLGVLDISQNLPISQFASGTRPGFCLLIILWDVKEPTHYSYKCRVIPVLWLSFVCERGVGEVGHLVGDLRVLLCPFPLGNKSCPVKWNKLNQ